MLVYMITNKINGKRYVGQTKQPLEDRIWQHTNDALSKKYPYPLHASIRKYGMENFEIKILVRCNSMEEMNHREEYLIALFDTLCADGRGYNIRPGGKNSSIAEETKKKMAKAATGRVKSIEERQKLSIAHTGRKLTGGHKEKLRIAGTGRTLTLEAKKKISDSKTGKPRSEETKIKLVIANTGKKHGEETIKKLRLCRTNLIAVECPQTGQKYPSMNEAARQTGVSLDQVRRSVNGGRPRIPFTFKKVSS